MAVRTLIWYRGHDLRVEDQPALRPEDEGIPVFILEPGILEGEEASFQSLLLKARLQALRAELRRLGSDLLLLRGRPEARLPEVVRQWGVRAVRTLGAVEPAWRLRDDLLEGLLADAGAAFEVLDGDTLVPPGALRTGAGGPFRVFTPFARAFRQGAPMGPPLAAPRQLAPLPSGVQGIPWPWDNSLAGEAAAPGARLQRFLDGGLRTYATGRDLLGEEGTSRLSGDLAWGALSVRTVWQAVQDRLGQGFDASVQAYLNELLWREFAHHTLWSWPELVSHPFRPAWRGFPWRNDPAGLEAWKEGRTGYGLVDAAARELLATGHVHNRARMIAATFLTKHLLVDWREGEAHYHRYLADYDPASNAMGWQWCAGCGADAQPWFRLFNPETQARRFDPQGLYRSRWLSGQGAPEPIVDLAMGRARFLEAAKVHLRT